VVGLLCDFFFFSSSLSLCVYFNEEKRKEKRRKKKTTVGFLFFLFLLLLLLFSQFHIHIFSFNMDPVAEQELEKARRLAEQFREANREMVSTSFLSAFQPLKF